MTAKFFAAAAALSCLIVTPATAADSVVKLGYGLFEPGRITVARGTRVLFRNDDTQAHEVSSTTQGQGFGLGELKPGQAKAQVFTRPGVVRVVCDLHPGMEMTVTVR
jgi:plastocyanin